MMKRFLHTIGRIIVTAAMVAIALVVGQSLWRYYLDAPWTRDGRVRADIVSVSPDVSGLVGEVLVRDNQYVHAGEMLFVIDRARFKLAVDQAQAVLDSRRATLKRATLDMDRYNSLSDLAASRQKQEQATAAAQVATAEYQQALADLAVAKLNLDRSAVRAAVNGIVTNFSLQPGGYVSAGKGVAALIATGTLHVEGYFEETKLSRIGTGDAVAIYLMGARCPLRGHVESISSGIEDRDRAESADLLANVNPTFSWVRLAQRIPVRVSLDATPTEMPLVVGQTATVVVQNRFMRPAWYSHGLISESIAAALGERVEQRCGKLAPSPPSSGGTPETTNRNAVL